MDCRFRCHSPVQLGDLTVQTHLFRIAQETVANAIKHGKASRIDIRLRETGDQIILGIRDNEACFPNAVAERKGLGLRIMQYRAEVVGGVLTIRKGLQDGAAVICSIPKRSAAQITGSNI